MLTDNDPGAAPHRSPRQAQQKEICGDLQPLSSSRLSWSFWWIIALIGFSSLACSIRIVGAGSVATPSPMGPVEAGSRLAQRTAAPPASPEPSPTLEVVEPTATSTPRATATSTPTPIPLPPAQLPPEHILVPAINLDSPVTTTGWTVIEQNGTQFSTWVVPDHAAGWHENSARPGHGSNVVLSGHHNLGSEVFRHLVELKLGDEIILQADGRDYRYAITDRFILPEYGVSIEERRQNAKWIMPTIDERITLITCWPYNTNTHRVIVVAKPVGFNG